MPPPKKSKAKNIKNLEKATDRRLKLDRRHAISYANYTREGAENSVIHSAPALDKRAPVPNIIKYEPESPVLRQQKSYEKAKDHFAGFESPLEDMYAQMPF